MAAQPNVEQFIAKFPPFDKVETWNMFNLFRLCRVERTKFQKNGNNVEATFDIVERIVKLVAFDNVAWTLLLLSWTGL